VESIGALALLIVMGSAMAQWTKGKQQSDVAWRAAEERRRQVTEEIQLQHRLWYLQHVRQLRQAEESRPVWEQDGADV
jgi:hypothetical protein